MLKLIVKGLLPIALYDLIYKKWIFYKTKKEFKKGYFYDLNRYLKYSESKEEKSEVNLLGLIVRRYHVIEKGLTMPETRLGFGKEIMKDLIKDCISYIHNFNKDDLQLHQAISVVNEYHEFHNSRGFKLDNDLLLMINEINREKTEIKFKPILSQKKFTDTEYFSKSNSNFFEFSRSRSSVRNFSDKEVSDEKLFNALEIAKSAPSACNRQCWRTYIFSNVNQIKEILEVQGGNRGFGHLTNRLIVIVAETGGFSGVSERNQAFIDGGIYAMNLLYGLHFQNIAACILNCSNTIEKDIKLRHLCNIKDSEVFIALISCGYPPNNFKVAASVRYPISKTNTKL